MDTNHLAVNDEKDLLIRLRSGDELAFEQLMQRYKKPLAKNMLRLLRSETLTEEALQDLFMKVWLGRARIEVDQPIRAYLFRVAENLVYDLFRKAARDKKMREHFRSIDTELYTHIEEGLFAKENHASLLEAIGKLPPQRRKVFVLCKIEEKSYQEVSELLHISPATVNDHITKANIFLKEYFTLSNKATVVLCTSILLVGL